MYYRNPGTVDIDRLTKAVRAMPKSRPLSLARWLLLSVGMVAALIVAFFIILGIDRSIAAF
jgi:hypothetical protein